MESHFLNDTHEAIHCTHGSLTSRWSWIIQAILATLAFACLLVKRFCEPSNYRRSWLIWLFDTSKQGLGAIVVHFWNIIVSELFRGEDPCTVYIISFLLDSSIGLLCIYVCIHLTQFIATKYKYPFLSFGEYGKPKPQFKYWRVQCLAYIVIVLVEKLIVSLLIQFKFWQDVRHLLEWPISNQKWELVLVVLVIPFIVNVLMFWVTDNFLTMHRSMSSSKYANSFNANDLTVTFPNQSNNHHGHVPTGSSNQGPSPRNSQNQDNFAFSDDDAELIDISFEPDENSFSSTRA